MFTVTYVMSQVSVLTLVLMAKGDCCYVVMMDNWVQRGRAQVGWGKFMPFNSHQGSCKACSSFNHKNISLQYFCPFVKGAKEDPSEHVKGERHPEPVCIFDMGSAMTGTNTSVP